MKLAQEPIADLVATVAVAIAAVGVTAAAVVVTVAVADGETKIAIAGQAAMTASRAGKFSRFPGQAQKAKSNGA